MIGKTTSNRYEIAIGGRVVIKRPSEIFVIDRAQLAHVKIADAGHTADNKPIPLRRLSWTYHNGSGDSIELRVNPAAEIGGGWSGQGILANPADVVFQAITGSHRDAIFEETSEGWRALL